VKRTAIDWFGYSGFVIMIIGLWPMVEGPIVRAAEPEKPSYSESRQFIFDIPAQSLAGALDTYSAVTGLEILYGSDIANERSSSTVRGTFTTVVALRRLLAGTNLAARAIAQNAVTIESAPLAAASIPQPAPDNSPHRYYYSLIQTEVRAVFCEENEIRPGSYRALLKFMVAANGRIRQSTLVGTTGNDERDQAIIRALDATSLESPPPVDLPQPIMMVILPQSSGNVSSCPYLR
jgi:TonB C terminal